MSSSLSFFTTLLFLFIDQIFLSAYYFYQKYIDFTSITCLIQRKYMEKTLVYPVEPCILLRKPLCWSQKKSKLIESFLSKMTLPELIPGTLNKLGYSSRINSTLIFVNAKKIIVRIPYVYLYYKKYY